MADDQAAIDRRMERFSFEPFDQEKTSWNAYLFQFEQMCRAKNLAGGGPNATAARRTLLLAYVGSEALAAVRHHFHPNDVNTVSYDDIKAALQQLYEPSLTIFPARIAFEEAVRRSNGESMTQFANRLRGLSAVCNYGNSLDERLRDRFVAGASHSRLKVEVRQRWPDAQLRKDQDQLVDVPFQMVLELAMAMEREDKEHTKGAGTEAEPDSSAVNKVAERKQWTGICYRCGKRDQHSPKTCPNRKLTRSKCGETGHLQSMCGKDDWESSTESSEDDSTQTSKGEEEKSDKSSQVKVMKPN